jgi:hypothetical protein
MAAAATALSVAAIAVGLGVIPPPVSSANDPANVFFTGVSVMYATGDLLQLGEKRAQAILRAFTPGPGSSAQGAVMVEHVGDEHSELLLSALPLYDGVGPSGCRLSQSLHLTILDQTTGATVYDGPVGDLETVSAGIFGPNETHTVTFIVSRLDPQPPRSSALPGQQEDPSVADALTVALEWRDSDP